jgi:hypothetical protein
MSLSVGMAAPGRKKAPKENLRRQVAERGTVKRVRGSGPVPLFII